MPSTEDGPGAPVPHRSGRSRILRLAASPHARIFMATWILFSLHFATNVVREHYPAFSLAERGSLKLDEYVGFHPDIFVHTDGHAYVGNNVAVSVLAAVPLFVFDPVLDALERHSKRKLAESEEGPDTTYRTPYPYRRQFFKVVRQAGLDLRFGAATVVTSAFFMAPFSALAVVLMFHVLMRRGIARRMATWLALLFGLGTPVFFRTSHLNHNMFLMHATFLAFVTLWLPAPGKSQPSAVRRFGAGMLAGFTLAADYMGAIIILVFYGYLLLRRASTSSWYQSFRESLVFVLGTVPPVLFLLYTQWVMYGNPFLPGQYWMPKVNFTEMGWRGFSWPAPDLLYLNLFSPSYGMFTFGPLLLLALIPGLRYAANKRILPRPERLFVLSMTVALLLFCAANQYSRMQFNSGFRYLVPLVPLLFLVLADHLVRMPRPLLVAVSALAVLQSWVLAVFRAPVPESWELFLDEGLQFPWLRVLRMTAAEDSPVRTVPLLATAILGITFIVIFGLWWGSSRLESRAS